jgi:hypothetical protein
MNLFSIASWVSLNLQRGVVPIELFQLDVNDKNLRNSKLFKNNDRKSEDYFQCHENYSNTSINLNIDAIVVNINQHQ